jgi:hypothetical protein
MQTNLGAGIGGTTTRANAMKFGRSIGKNASAGQPVSITLTGVTSGVIITRNYMHDIGSGVAWGEGLDVHLIDADIRDNHFERMSSTGLIVYGRSTGSGRNNKFYEVHFALRIQGMNESAAVNALDGLVVIENNFIQTFEHAGYVMQQHNSAGTIWTTQVQFNSNFIQNVSTLIANMLSAADVSMDGNVIDCSAPITNQLVNFGMTSFTNNWIGGNIATTPSSPWYGTGNQYTLNQRLNGSTPPAGYTFPTIAQSVGPRKQRGWFAWNE